MEWNAPLNKSILFLRIIWTPNKSILFLGIICTLNKSILFLWIIYTPEQEHIVFMNNMHPWTRAGIFSPPFWLVCSPLPPQNRSRSHLVSEIETCSVELLYNSSQFHFQQTNNHLQRNAVFSGMYNELVTDRNLIS